ncbi:MAG: hypothetical protein R2939_03515 [Kofleriaceae bacterium]
MSSRGRRGPLAALALAAALVLGGQAATARAEGCDDGAGGTSDSGQNFHIEYINGQKVTVIDKVVQVCGKVPRPSVVYVLQAKTINYEWETLKQDFLPLVMASVRRPPF